MKGLNSSTSLDAFSSEFAASRSSASVNNGIGVVEAPEVDVSNCRYSDNMPGVYVAKTFFAFVTE
jgi:hypothetical protein